MHHDRGAQRDGRRLVYGGHTIGIAAAQATRALPRIATFAGWHSCDHLAPVCEGDTLRSELELEAREPLAGGAALLHLRSRVRAWREHEAASEHEPVSEEHARRRRARLALRRARRLRR